MHYSELAQLYEKLEKTASRLDKTEILAEFLKKLKHEKQTREIIYLLKGRIFPDYDERETGISEQLVIKALSKTTGISPENVTKKWKTLGDLGKVAEELIKNNKQKTLSEKKLSVEKVLENLKKLPDLTGLGSTDKKIALISELLTSSPLEAKYIIRTLLQDLRTGTGEGVLRDAIVQACFGKEDKQNYELVQEAYDKSNDFGLVFEQACKGKSTLLETELTPGKPVKVMLFLKVKDFKEAFEVVGKPALIDTKYDGFRMMINKQGNDIKIFTRRLDNVTQQFPEVKEYVKKYVTGNSFILDSEAVGYDKKGKYRAFQDISQRIKRKYNIEKIAKELPVEINVFDILYYNGKSLLKTPFKARRELIEKIIKNQAYKIRVSKAIITASESQAEKFYKQALKNRQEGVMIKNLNAPYKPGARVGYGVKLKPVENEFDLVIVKAEYGTGKRAGGLTSYTVACQDKNKFLEIGKVSTGLKEKESEGLSFTQVSDKLKKIIISEKGREVIVKPELVVTVTYQNIQRSPTYESGFALRFPRFTRLRPDRSPADIASLDEIKKEFKKAQFNPYK